MSWEVSEQAPVKLTQSGRNPKMRTLWQISNSDGTDLPLARERLIEKTPEIKDTLLRSKIASLELIGPDLWEAVVIYGVDPMPSNEEVVFSGGSGNGRATITQAIAVHDAIAIDGYMPTQSLAIGVDSSGNAQGVEIDIPQPWEALEVWIEADLFTPEYKRLLRRKRGHVNSETWYGFEPHEAKFKNAEWTGRIEKGEEDEDLVRIKFTFDFEESFIIDPNPQPGDDPTGLLIPGFEQRINKRGWDILDIREEVRVVESEEADPATGKKQKWRVRVPVMARACQVHHEFDFAEFGIGS